jgi:pimeloyl-ACP methyl ester carboxylesterase
MGERAHLAAPGVGIDTHVQDILGVLEMEDLRDVVPCAHSYGGVPVTAAADRMPERIRLLIYVDALVRATESRRWICCRRGSRRRRTPWRTGTAGFPCRPCSNRPKA